MGPATHDTCYACCRFVLSNVSAPRRSRMINGAPGPAVLVACFCAQAGLIGVGYLVGPGSDSTTTTTSSCAVCPSTEPAEASWTAGLVCGLTAFVLFLAGVGATCLYLQVQGACATLGWGAAAGTAAGVAVGVHRLAGKDRLDGEEVRAIKPF